MYFTLYSLWICLFANPQVVSSAYQAAIVNKNLLICLVKVKVK